MRASPEFLADQFVVPVILLIEAHVSSSIFLICRNTLDIRDLLKLGRPTSTFYPFDNVAPTSRLCRPEEAPFG